MTTVKTGMKQNKILFTGYKSRWPNPSNIVIKEIEGVDHFLFSNNFIKIEKEIKQLIENNNYEKIIMFGQKPRILNINIELESHYKGETLYSNYPIKELTNFLKEKNFPYKKSRNPGNSYCNYAYGYLLKYLKENHIKTEVIFIHLPYLKNFKNKEIFTNLLKEIIIEESK